MSTIELIPLEKGNRLVLDNTTVTTIGRTPNIGCLDKKISRNHAELHVKSDGTLWIKPIHHNPTFYRTKSSQLITLTKDQEFQLDDNDEIGLLPDDYFYRISIKLTDPDQNQEQIKEPSAVPKSPVQNKEHSPVKSDSKEKSPIKDPSLQPEGGIILRTTRALPTWMSNVATSEPKTPKGRDKSKTTITPTKTTPSPSKYRTYIGRKKVEGVVYDDDDDDDNNDEEEKESNGVSSTKTTNVQTPKTTTKSSKRERCPYGKFCYRKNPAHRQEAIHPGDPDWDNKENDTDETKPECPYGTDCYRKNPDHFTEYSHTKKRSSVTKPSQNSSKRKAKDDDDDDEDDDDGLPNEYDYNDSFIDDEKLDDSARIDREIGDSLDASDKAWKPHRKARQSENDDEDVSTDDSEIDLLKEEAAEFVQSSSIYDQRPAKKKARVQMPKDDTDDD
ncbi:hypothetical protein I4U23_002772 [Adineta vaga]|nr:hypothetical protein I4U23_002772 [Adineta vaga]